MMRNLRFLCKLTGITLARLCRRQGLLAMLIILCMCLPLCIAPAAQHLFSQGVSFSGITLAITAPEGDPIPELVAELLPSMEDISQYCQVYAMDSADAISSLEKGEVTAVLVLPEGFVEGILNGTNPDVELIVSSDRPLEALLTLWVGQSAVDMLSSIQSAIYAVLDLYLENPTADLQYSQVVSQINLRYINWTLSRQDLFRIKHISVTGLLPIDLHYGFSLLCFLLLALPPFFQRVYTSSWIASQQRFQAVGKKPFVFWSSSLLACWVLLFGISLAVTLVFGKGSFLLCTAVCLLCSLFCAAFTGLCCLTAGSIGNCGILSSLLSLVFLTVSGGILPPVMLPQVLRNSIPLSPITWMRSLLAFSAGEANPISGAWVALLLGSVVLLLCSLLLFRKRFYREVSRQ